MIKLKTAGFKQVRVGLRMESEISLVLLRLRRLLLLFVKTCYVSKSTADVGMFG